jgi:hypothetical protein
LTAQVLVDGSSTTITAQWVNGGLMPFAAGARVQLFVQGQKVYLLPPAFCANPYTRQSISSMSATSGAWHQITTFATDTTLTPTRSQPVPAAATVSSGIWTLTYTGLYRLTASLTRVATANAGEFAVYMVCNSPDVPGTAGEAANAWRIADASSTGYCTLNGSETVHFFAGDKLYWWAYQNTGVTGTFGANRGDHVGVEFLGSW